ncbi:hypothetical protein Tco_1153393 [Tanacetum coccineum]
MMSEAQEMWEAIERLQQGESRIFKMFKDKLNWGFGHIHLHDGETIESYYTRISTKNDDEMIRNNLTVATMQEVNELRVERMAKNANPLALVATAQTLQDPYYQTSNTNLMQQHQSFISKPDLMKTTRSRQRDSPNNNTTSESASEEDKLPQTQKQEMWILLQGYKNGQSGIWTIWESEGMKAKTALKDSTYHKEKMLLCKQAEKATWKDSRIQVPNARLGTDSEPLETVNTITDDNVFANDIQHFDQSESISNTCAVETDDSNVTPDSPDMCDNDIQDDQNDVECDDERETSRNLGESNSIGIVGLVAHFKIKQTGFERYKALMLYSDYDNLNIS